MTPPIPHYTCADGTRFPVQWEEPNDATLTWRWNQDHFPAPRTPLSEAIFRLAGPGRQRAFAEAGVPIPAVFSRIQLFHGFQYHRTNPFTPDQQAQYEQAADAFRDQCGGVLAVWRDYCLPRIEAGCRAVREGDDDTPLAAVANTYGYTQNLTQLAGQPVAGLALQRLIAFLTAATGAPADLLALELAQGWPNATLDVDQELWGLARLAGHLPAVRDAVLRCEPAAALETLRDVAGGPEFLGAFDRVIERYGWRADGWDISYPTWSERPEAALRLVRSLLAEDVPEPEEAVREAARRRESLVRATEMRLGANPAVRDRFHELLAPMAHYNHIREGRALWQMIAAGSLRTALLRRGRRLAATGAISAPEDVFFLLPEEVETGAGRDLRAVAAERRQQWAWWSRVRPPAMIGAGVPLPTTAPARCVSTRGEPAPQ